MKSVIGKPAVGLETTTIRGLHDFVVEDVVRRFARPGLRAVDLGAGSGALAVRLQSLRCDVVAVDKNAEGFKAALPFIQLNLDDSDFSGRVGEAAFSLVTAIEVIEHVESPIGFLRNVCRLLRPEGVAVLTTPNVDNAPARVKFLLTEKVRMMDEVSEPTHISPIFWDLLTRQFLPRAGLELAEHHLFPRRGYSVTRARYAWALRGLAWFLAGECLEGDNHVLVLRSRRNGN
jgi:2-polyprenyl-3-methyl-5-hydroxy-6-metoxy-1,4-benzoquinol methylase